MLPYFVLQTPVPIRHTNTHFNTEPVQGVGHAATAAATATKTKKAQVAFRKKKKEKRRNLWVIILACGPDASAMS